MAVAVLVMLAIPVAAIVASRSGSEGGAELRRGLSGEGSPLAGGSKTTFEDAVEVFPVSVTLPSSELASRSSVAQMWMRTGGDPQLYVEYDSGIVVTIRPASGFQGTEEYAAAQVRDGVPGSLVEIRGIKAFEVPQDDLGDLGSVRFVLGKAVVVVLGRGDFTPEALRSVATSIVDRAAQ